MTKGVLVDSRYIPFVQQPYCCVPAGIQTILHKNAFPLFPQEQIGKWLGLIVPPEARGWFWDVEVLSDPPPSGYGTRIGQKQFSIDKMLKKQKLPLTMQFVFASQIKSPRAFLQKLSEIEQKDQDALICFKASTINASASRGGHVCVFDRIVGRKIRVIDPEPKYPKWRLISLETLYKAVKEHGDDKSGGLWIFNKSS